MSIVRIPPALRIAVALALLALAINVGMLAVGARRTWSDFALPLLVLGNLLAMHPRVRESRWTTRVYYPVSIAIALTIVASSMWHMFHRG